MAGCGNQPPAPDWAVNAEAAAQRASTAYLQGQPRIESLQWQKARASVASTGRTDLAARMELIRCATQVASLEWDDCPTFQALQPDAAAPEQAYARYLNARPRAGDAGLLPKEQQAAARHIAAQAASAPLTAGEVRQMTGAGDPLSRLLAAAVLLRAGNASPELLQAGVDLASAQGWRRALMAWLLLQAKAAERMGDADMAAHIHRRLELLQK
ncbi:hypothetical protein GCM10010975_15210 [Comamonas phosphati]|nr:hypothetical protein GCM10010975_15210 [Comamonas phosphati]